MSNDYKYRELSGLTKALVVLLALGAGWELVSLYSSSLQLELLNRVNFTEAEAEANNARQLAVSLLQIGLYLATVVCFGVWIVRANRNVRALGARGLPITPGWAVGYFFVPILNLFRPYQAMRDLMKASRDPGRWRKAAGSPIILLWWLLWIVSNIAGQAAFRISAAANNPESLKDATQVQIVAAVLGIFPCLAAIGVVLLITRAQETSADEPLSPEWPEDHWQGNEPDDDDRIARRKRRAAQDDDDRIIT